MRPPALVLSALALALAACADPPTASSLEASRAGGTAVYWNAVARDLVVETRANAFVAARGYALLSVAQYHAVVTAEQSTNGSLHSYERAAITGASVAALSYLFPAKADALQQLAAALLLTPGHPGARPGDDATGLAIGRAAAEPLIDRARTDRFSPPWTGTVPTGAGTWFSTAVPPAPPVGALLGQAKTYLLESPDQFAVPAPPDFDSQEFEDALKEVAAVAVNRTSEQERIAQFWALPLGTYQPPGYWNEEAARLITRYRLGGRKAAHVLALMNMVGWDALVATHHVKFTYWLLRPSQADPTIQLAVGLPNFPSYPSNHATLSSGMAAILGAEFPADAARLEALAEQAAMSRLYGGIHYRFDNEAGLTLGRAIAAWALMRDVGRQPFVLAP